jgi:aryl-alcohol dehydrogenase-like predicted oxidoreductase
VEQRILAGFRVSVLGLGTSRLASLGAGGSPREAARLLDAAAELGVSFIDTADTYGSTDAERWLGELLHARPDRFVLATKCGLATVDLPAPLRMLNQPAKKIKQRIGPGHYLGPAYVRRSIEASLRRLRRERVEIFFLHEPPAGVEQRDELFGVLDEAQAAGKIGAYGVCSPDAGILRAVLAAGRCEVVQTAIDPLVTDRLQAALEPASVAGRVQVVANHVLARREGRPAAGGDDAAGSAALLDKRLDTLSAERGVSRARLLIRHAAATRDVRVVLTGTSDPAHLAENVSALADPAAPEDLLA